LKKYILFFVLGFTVATVKAQSGFNYYEFGAGFSASYGKAEADLKKQDYHPAFSLNFVYNFSPYFPITAELQKGTFSGGGTTPAVDASGRYFTNSYLSFNIHGDVQAGEIMDYDGSWILDRIKGFYLGTGLGVIHNNMTRIQRYNQYPLNAAIGDTEGFRGADNSVNIIIPIRFGYEFKIYDDYDQPRYGIDLGIQHYFAPGEGLDGYNDPTAKYKNNATDQYTFVTIGFKYNFGNTTSYTKLVRKFQ
jgi:hypothetical protein